MTKILCLIIDSTPHVCWQETYAAHRRIWQECLDRSPEVDGYFLYSDPRQAPAHVIEGRRFTVRGDESHGTILKKTLKAIEVLLDDHDYVIRTNISSLYDFALLLRRLDLPKENLYTGHLVNGQHVTGSGMIFSRDVAKKLLLPVSFALDPWDDIAIWQILSACGIRARHEEAFIYDYAKGPEQLLIGQHIHYRLRDYNDPQRVEELRVTERAFAEIYHQR